MKYSIWNRLSWSLGPAAHLIVSKTLRYHLWYYLLLFSSTKLISEDNTVTFDNVNIRWSGVCKWIWWTIIQHNTTLISGRGILSSTSIINRRVLNLIQSQHCWPRKYSLGCNVQESKRIIKGVWSKNSNKVFTFMSFFMSSVIKMQFWNQYLNFTKKYR